MNMHDQERTPWDFLLFGVVFGGLLLGAAGIVLATPWVAMAGCVSVLLSLICFFLKQV